jgi:hypothetical protein
VVVTEVAAAAASTQFVLGELGALGIDVSPGERLVTTGQDIIGMAPAYLPIIALGLGIAFPVAAAVVRWLLPGWDRIGYPLAGFVAMLTALLVMIEMMDIVPIAGARSIAGMAFQGLAGALGGWVFIRILERGRRPDPA